MNRRREEDREDREEREARRDAVLHFKVNLMWKVVWTMGLGLLIAISSRLLNLIMGKG